MSTFTQTLYDAMPRAIQEMAMSAKTAKDQYHRRGGRYGQYLGELQRMQWANRDEMEAWRLRRFGEVFGEAARNVPYYRRVFNDAGVDPTRLAGFSCLRQFPVIEKPSLRQTPSDYLDPRRKAVYVGLTGGTTGMPLASPHDADTMQFGSALMDRFYLQCGARWRANGVYCGAKAIVPATELREFWRLNRATATLFMSMRHMSEIRMPAYVGAIAAHEPEYITGITSFLYDIARWIVDVGRPGSLRIPFIFPTSETLSGGMREVLELGFSGRVFDYYGSTEGAPMITECRAGRYHIVPESGYFEFLRPDGTEAGPNEPAELLVTSFRCRLRPLLRYRIGDTAAYTNDSCPCGLPWTVITRLHGRLAEWIVTRDGRTISCMGDLIMKSGTSLGFRELQVRQITPERFVVLAVKSPEFTLASEESLRQRFIDNMYHDVTMEFQYTDNIERSPGGKRRLIVSEPAQRLFDRCYTIHPDGDAS